MDIRDVAVQEQFCELAELVTLQQREVRLKLSGKVRRARLCLGGKLELAAR